MKKLCLAIAAIAIMGSNHLLAQTDYNIAAGLGIDFFSGVTLVGPSGKFFLADEHAIQGEFMFETGVTAITAIYEYHGPISGADGLKWFTGLGPSVWILSNGIGTRVALRPTAGLDYKIKDVALAFSFDWRPFLGLGNLGNEVGAFGIGIRYVIE